jgi:hypothetical protein
VGQFAEINVHLDNYGLEMPSEYLTMTGMDGPDGNRLKLFPKRVACRAQGEFQRLAWNFLNKGLNDPVEAARN